MNGSLNVVHVVSVAGWVLTATRSVLPTDAQKCVLGHDTPLRPSVAAPWTLRCQPPADPVGMAVCRIPPPSSTPTHRFADGQSRPVIAVVPPTSVSTVADGGDPSWIVAKPGEESGTRQVLVVGQAIAVLASAPKPAGSSDPETY